MELRDRLYPYPILAAFKDDYYDSEFDVFVEPTISSKKISFEFMYNLINEGLWDLISSNKAKVVVHIECPSTSFREVIEIKNTGMIYSIDSGKINNVIQICSFIIANQDIENYINEDFNDVYSDMDFFIGKYNFLAIGSQFNIPIEKDYDEIKNVSSIFSVFPGLDENMEFIERDFFQDKIHIKIPKKQFDMYKISIRNPKNHSYMHAMIIVPILIEIIESLKSGGWEEFEELRWFKSLEKSLRKNGIEFNEESILNIDVFSFVQKIMESPIIISLENLFMQSIMRDGDEDEY